MWFGSDIDPNTLYMNTGEACATLGIDRNQLRQAMVRKDIEYDRVAGHTLVYRTSVESYKQKLENIAKPRNPYERKEASCSAT
jgi:hypothetical protein